MSLRAWKETLKPCSGFSSSSFTFSTSPVKLSQELEPRKPPKTSLSRQLLRLQEEEYHPPPAPPNVGPEIKGKEGRAGFKLEHGEVEEEEDGGEEKEEEEEERGRVKFGGPRSAAFLFDHTGPFEPLPLSSPVAAPSVQVSLISLWFGNSGLLEDDVLCLNFGKLFEMCEAG